MNFPKLRATATDRPVEVFSSVVLIVGGLAISLGGGTAQWAALGSVFSTVGGILLSWATATIRSHADAAAILRPEIEAIRRHLGTVAGQIGQVAHEDDDPRIGLALVSQATRTLYTVVSDLQALIGTRFDPQDLIDTVDQVELLAERLSTYTEDRRDEAVPTEIAKEAAQLRSQIVARFTDTSVVSRPRRSEAIECPICHNVANYMIRSIPGDTTTPTCPVCGREFNVHRAADGTIFIREHGKPVGNPYDRVMRDQGIRSLPPAWRDRTINVVTEVMMTFPERRTPTWEEMERRVLERLTSLGDVADQSDIKKVRHLMFRARLLVGEGERGISLASDVSLDNAVKRVNHFLVDRMFREVGPAIDLHEVNRVLYGGAETSHRNELQDILAQLSGAPVVTG